MPSEVPSERGYYPNPYDPGFNRYSNGRKWSYWNGANWKDNPVTTAQRQDTEATLNGVLSLGRRFFSGS